MEDSQYFEDLIPEGSIPTCGLRIVSYIGQDGQMGFRFTPSGDTAITNLIGLIQMVHHDICTKAIDICKHGGGGDLL